MGGSIPRETLATEHTARAPKLRTRYFVLFRDETSRVVELPNTGELLVGRGDECGLRLEDPKISRKHARFACDEQSVVVTDLDSQNGTFVSGARLTDSRALVSGDVVEIGRCALVFHAPRGDKPLPERVPAAAGPCRTLDLGSVMVVIADPTMQRLYELIERLGASDLPVLVHGETGSGKELAARALHHASRRREHRLVAINCAALHESLAESELFGHQKGAFTGASQAKAGYLEAANGGTVFFDEIGELPLQIQAKLLRALDTQRVVRLGDVEERPIDVRVVAATNRNLEQEVAAQRFRQDLYFRLSGATLWVPPLRDRPLELAILAERALDAARSRLGKPPMRISDAAMQLLASHPWPGNVRELGNVMEFAAAAFDGPELDAEHLRARLPNATAAPTDAGDTGFRPLDDEIRELERKRIVAALEASGGNQKRAAELIGMPLRTFVSKLGQHGLRPKKR